MVNSELATRLGKLAAKHKYDHRIKMEEKLTKILAEQWTAHKPKALVAAAEGKTHYAWKFTMDDDVLEATEDDIYYCLPEELKVGRACRDVHASVDYTDDENFPEYDLTIYWRTAREEALEKMYSETEPPAEDDTSGKKKRPRGGEECEPKDRWGQIAKWKENGMDVYGLVEMDEGGEYVYVYRQKDYRHFDRFWLPRGNVLQFYKEDN